MITNETKRIRCLLKLPFLLALLVCWGTVPNVASAANYYFDVNGADLGSGVTNGGSYDVSMATTTWTQTAAGNVSTAVRADRNDVTFSAGIDASNCIYSLTGSLSQPSKIYVEEGIVTISASLSAYSLSLIQTSDGTTVNFPNDWDFYNKTITVNTLGTSSVSITRIWSGSTRSGGITKNGPGTLLIQNDANHSGAGYVYASSVNNGVIRIRTGNAFRDPEQSPPTFTVNNGGSLDLDNNLNMSSTVLSLNGMGYNNQGALNNYTGTNYYTWTNALVLAGATRINASSGRLTMAKGYITNSFDLVFGGAGEVLVSNAIHTSTGALIKDGSGLLTLAGTNSYAGTTIVSNGTLVVVGSLASAKVMVGSSSTVSGSGRIHWHPGESVTVLGSLDISKLNMTLHATGELPAGDTVIVDYSASGATLTGAEFASVTRDEIASASKLVYDTSNKRIVLRTPPRGTLVRFF